MSSSFPLKTVCETDIRRVLIDPVSGFKFADLQRLLSTQFPAEAAGRYQVQYTDDEADLITVASDEELQEAFRQARAAGCQSLKLVLRPSSKGEKKKEEGAEKKEDASQTGGAAAAEAPPVVHWGFVCDGSGMKPIVGPRYHKKNSDYDLCEAEFLKLPEADRSAFVKIEKPRRGRWFRRFCGGREGGRGWRWRRGQNQQGSRQNQNRTRAARPAKLRAEFVKDATMPDGTVVKPGEAFTKTWVVKNAGKQAWPEGTALVHVGGDAELRPAAPRVPVGTVGSGDEVQLSVELAAPESDGRYWSYWRLVAGPRRFRMRLWADVSVRKEVSVEAALEAANAAEQTPTTPKEQQEDEEGSEAPLPMPPTTEPVRPPSKAAALAAAALAAAAPPAPPLVEVEPEPEPEPEPTPATNSTRTEPTPEPQTRPVDPMAIASDWLVVARERLEQLAEQAHAEMRTALEAERAKAAVTEPQQPQVEEPSVAPRFKDAVATLTAMGFAKEKFMPLLERHNGDVMRVTDELLQ